MNEMIKTVSVIIPTHNRANEIRYAIDSVLEQIYPAFEIIIIDDDSNDDTLKQLEMYHSSQIKIIHFHTNRGVSAARNHGIAKAKSEWIAFLDSDDRWMPTKLAAQLEVMQSNPQLRLCHTEEIWIRNGKRVNQMNIHEKAGGNVFLRSLPRCAISPSSVLMHRSLFDDYGYFDVNLPACEDYDLWLRISSQEDVVYLDTPLITKYGGHEDQLSRRFYGIDRFRLIALDKLLQKSALDQNQFQAALSMLREKLDVFEQGATKRQRKIPEEIEGIKNRWKVAL